MIDKKKSHYWVKKFFFAFRGIFSTLKEEKSMIFHIVSAFVVVIIGAALKITNWTNWAVLMIVITIVIAMEFVNTAIENLVDMISFKYNFNARKIKDIAAAATLVVAIGALASTLFIFVPRIVEIVQYGYNGSAPIAPPPPAPPASGDSSSSASIMSNLIRVAYER